jgi:predicted Zn-dependent protease
VTAAPARIAVALVALCALGWLVVQERNVRLQDRGIAAAERRDVPRAEASFRAARLLDPDPLPDVRLAFVYQGSGRPEQARRVLEDVLAREPDNLSVWSLLFALTRDSDPATARRALAARRRLDPLNAR